MLVMARTKIKPKTINIVLKLGTYDRLEAYKTELITKTKDPKITFDDTINALLDEHKGG